MEPRGSIDHTWGMEKPFRLVGDFASAAPASAFDAVPGPMLSTAGPQNPTQPVSGAYGVANMRGQQKPRPPAVRPPLGFSVR